MTKKTYEVKFSSIVNKFGVPQGIVPCLWVRYCRYVKKHVQTYMIWVNIEKPRRLYLRVFRTHTHINIKEDYNKIYITVLQTVECFNYKDAKFNIAKPKYKQFCSQKVKSNVIFIIYPFF